MSQQQPLPQESFRDFIQRMLKIAKINELYRELLTDPDGLKLFQKAFTHSTHDPKNNLEVLEFIGDGIIKGINGQYIARRFPEIAQGSEEGTGEGALSKIRRMLEQRKTLSDVGLKLGFWPYVRADEETLTRNRNKTLEDVFEAFIGALVEIIDQRLKRGLGYNYAYNFVEHCLNDIEIDLSKESLDDPITLLNELYKARELAGGRAPLKWGDAVYVNYKYYMPKVSELPKTAKEGELVFLLVDGNDKNIKNVYIFSRGRWVPAHNAPAPDTKFFAPPAPPPRPAGEQQPIEQDDTIKMIWYSGVFGFLNARTQVSANKSNFQDIITNPWRYAAETIGQGIAFRLQDAKKLAAHRALDYLKARNITK